MNTETKLTFDCGVGFQKGDIISIMSTPWWRTMDIVVEVTATELIIKWHWWRERWFQQPIIGLIYGVALYLITDL